MTRIGIWLAAFIVQSFSGMNVEGHWRFLLPV